ncbi:MAG TPA: 2Fe-2S iron-sulfur cluster-binding protein [Caulobacteraceae bacterium]|nr:2Fe-2S iron-sulfur cluster-binding protein [Caulobacteraceae bacterium]
MSETVQLTVNGRACEVRAPTEATLLHALRNILDHKAARFGCGEEACGACRVLVDGAPVFACTLPLETARGRAVVTAEGLAARPAGAALIDAFLAEQAGQCGWCLSGVLMSALALLEADPAPSRSQIATALDAHLCRCGVQARMIAAIERAGATLRAGR